MNSCPGLSCWLSNVTFSHKAAASKKALKDLKRKVLFHCTTWTIVVVIFVLLCPVWITTPINIGMRTGTRRDKIMTREQWTAQRRYQQATKFSVIFIGSEHVVYRRPEVWIIAWFVYYVTCFCQTVCQEDSDVLLLGLKCWGIQHREQIRLFVIDQTANNTNNAGPEP